MKKFGIITRMLLVCAGVDQQTMAQCTSSEVSRYKIMGSCVLLPTFLALFSGGYAMDLISKNSMFALLFAPCWALILFILDRAVVSTTRPGKMSWGIGGRIFLSLVIAFTISEPVILRLFSDTIEDRRTVVIAKKQSLATDDLKKQVSVLRQISIDEYEKVEAKNQAYIQEVDGTGGSKIPYRGPIAKVKWQAYENALKNYTNNDSLRKAEIAMIEQKIANKEQEVYKKDANGFLGNMMLLGELASENSQVWWCIWIIRLLFLCIELIPILIKMGSAKTIELYYEVMDINDKICADIQALLSEERRDVMRLEQSILLEKRRHELISQEIRFTMEFKLKDYDYFMEKVRYAMEQQLKLKAYVVEKVNDEDFREELLKQLSEIYEGYMITLNSLMIKSKQHYANSDSNSL